MKQKNVLFLMCDQLNAGVLSHCMELGLAPNLAELQAKAANFSTAYCSTPLCTPSRASIVTGLHPHQHLVVGNIMRRDYPCCGGPETEQGIENTDVTTEKILWQKGWRVGHVGKWHLLGEDLEYYPQMYREHYEYADEMAETFRNVEQTMNREDYMNWYGWKIPVEPTEKFRQAAAQIQEPWKSAPNLNDFYSKIGPIPMKPEDTFDYRVASKAVEFLESGDQRPFMLTCSFNAPHDPNIIPREYYEKTKEIPFTLEADPVCEPLFRKDLSREVADQGGPEFLLEFKRVYYASVMYIDDQVGRVLRSLQESGRAEDTVVVFLADHGDMVGGHGMFWKCTMAFYDEIARVPFMIAGADRLPAGNYDFPVELTDLMPTLLDLCGVEQPDNLEGKSLVPCCNGEVCTENLTAFSERLDWNRAHTRQARSYENFAFMLRDKTYKYELYQQHGTVTEFLYNMEQDPGERRDLIAAGEEAPAAETMRKKLSAFLKKTDCACDFIREL